MKIIKNIFYVTTIFILFISFIGCNNKIDTLDEEMEVFQEIKSYLNNKINNNIINNINLDTSYNNTIPISWSSSNESVLNSQGVYTKPTVDTLITLTAVIKININSYTYKKDVLVKGIVSIEEYKNIIEIYIPDIVSSDITFPTNDEAFNGGLFFFSSNQNVLGDDGKYNIETDNDQEVLVTYFSQIDNQIIYGEKKVLVKGSPYSKKCDEVIEELTENYAQNAILTEDLNLPTLDETGEISISWESEEPTILTNEGKYINEVFDKTINLTATVSYKEIKKYVTFQFKTLSIWDGITKYLNMINYQTINQNDFKTFNGPNTIIYSTPNYGYIPFFYQDIDSSKLIMSESKGSKTYIQQNNNENANSFIIKEGIVPETSVNRRLIKKVAGATYKANEWIVIHDTGDTNNSASAWNQIINTDSRAVSWHFTVDDKDIYQHIPLDEIAAHAGDGSRTPDITYYNETYRAWCIGGGNRNGIGIETCINRGVDYNQVMRNTANLVAKLMIEFNLGIEKIKQHRDFSGKMCPQSMIRLNRWNEFLTLVRIEYFIANNLQNSKIEFKSLTPTLLDNTGKILSAVSTKTSINYQVTITHNNETKVFNYTTIVNPKI